MTILGTLVGRGSNFEHLNQLTDCILTIDTNVMPLKATPVS
jgi:hypothetical protein